MKKIFILLLVSIVLTYPNYSKASDKPNVKVESFSDLGRYIQTFEINEPDNIETVEKEDNFETEAIEDIAKRYESYAVELKLDDTDSNAIDDVNAPRLFSLKANKTQYKIERQIKAENMIWDSNKAFTQAFLNDSRHMAPIPSVVNSQKLTAKVSDRVSASLGQTNLFDSLGPSLLFIRANESTYNTGSVLAYKGNKLNMSLGSFSSSFNHSASGGAVISTVPVALPKNSGSFSMGGGYFAKDIYNDNKSTGGIFGEYSFKRLKLNAQIGQSKYASTDDIDTSVYFMPEYKLTDSFSVKTRFIRNISQNNMQDELVLSYKPLKNKNNLEIELNASNQYNDTANIKQRLKLSTSFKI